MKDLVDEIKKLKLEIESNLLSKREVVLKLERLLASYQDSRETDSEKGFIKSLWAKNLKERQNQNKRNLRRIKNLKIVLLMNDLGIQNVTEEEIHSILLES